MQSNKMFDKRGRIIIRNLPYEATEKTLHSTFKAYGKIGESIILKDENGKSRGTGFVQFYNPTDADKAIIEHNTQSILGRPVRVASAIPKYKFAPDQKKFKAGAQKQKKEVNKDKPDEDDIEMKEDSAIGKSDEGDMSEDDKEDESMESKSDDDDEDSEMEENVKKKPPPEIKHNAVSKDVMEGKTVFLRNLNPMTCEEEVHELLSTHGDLKYVLFCKDKATERFRGSGFAQFLTKEAADKCLEVAEDPLYKDQFTIGGRRFEVTRALGRKDAANRVDANRAVVIKAKDKSDKRNMYLAREGVVREGTRPANGVSNRDLMFRRDRELVKRRMLANLSVFVSPVRVFVCNLPLDLTEEGLREIFKKYSPEESVISECRIMRNMLELDENQSPVSKGHGFVTFTEHKHALLALRRVNNNPEIFTKGQRPVVEFSLENRAALRAKENRTQVSREKNAKRPKLNDKKHTMSAEEASDHLSALPEKSKTDFMGASYDPKKQGKKAFHTHIGPKIRHRDRKGDKAGGGKTKITRNQINQQTKANKVKVRSMKMATKKGKERKTMKAAAKKLKTKADKGTSVKRKAKRKNYLH